MGSPLGPILADFFLAKLENGKLKDIIKEFDIYYRYVDDTFIVADGNVNTDELLLKFNKLHPLLTFTCEEEQENKPHLLDVLLVITSRVITIDMIMNNTFCSKRHPVNNTFSLCDISNKQTNMEVCLSFSSR
ncbi:unnamed protein product [Trichobilharzia regenti]|nr:unnamed protein product [Trichobilharzia regenti]